MRHISLTSFGRQPVSAGLLATKQLAQTETTRPATDKWTVLDDLRIARKAHGLSDRELSVLSALLTFLPTRALSDDTDLVVFPSNASLSERAHGMPESTLRRHLATLAARGLITRHDSPNGKRYAARDRSGRLLHAFGFDLRPLLLRAAEIAASARRTEAETLALTRARETVVLSLRDATKLIAYGRTLPHPTDWDTFESRLTPIRRALRRRNTLPDLAAMARALQSLHADLHPLLSPETSDPGGSDSRYERHHTNTDKDSDESETPNPIASESVNRCIEHRKKTSQPPLPLGLVLKACPDVLPYAKGPLRNYADLSHLAGHLRGMLGINSSAWGEACRIMGTGTAAIVVAAMLQRATEIRNPGGYLRALTSRAAEGRFSVGPMIMALLNVDGQLAA